MTRVRLPSRTPHAGPAVATHATRPDPWLNSSSLPLLVGLMQEPGHRASWGAQFQLIFVPALPRTLVVRLPSKVPRETRVGPTATPPPATWANFNIWALLQASSRRRIRPRGSRRATCASTLAVGLPLASTARLRPTAATNRRTNPPRRPTNSPPTPPPSRSRRRPTHTISNPPPRTSPISPRPRRCRPDLPSPPRSSCRRRRPSPRDTRATWLRTSHVHASRRRLPHHRILARRRLSVHTRRPPAPRARHRLARRHPAGVRCRRPRPVRRTPL